MSFQWQTENLQSRVICMFMCEKLYCTKIMFFLFLCFSGIDVAALLGKLGVGESFIGSQVAKGASTFVMAYAVHKVFAPARIAITLTSTPFIVQYLRRIGVLKSKSLLKK